MSGVLGFNFACDRRPHAKLNRRTKRTVRRYDGADRPTVAAETSSGVKAARKAKPYDGEDRTTVAAKMSSGVAM